MSEKKYPYIGKSNRTARVVLFTSESTGFAHLEALKADWDEEVFKNITSEYIANTYGEVVSPEHAEFIIELGRSVGACISTSWRKGLFFNFCTGLEGGMNLDFFVEDVASDGGEKQITIPLPPKTTSASKINRDIERAVKDKINDELDQVENPSHYQLIEGVESIEIISRSMTQEQWRGFCLGNMLKYRIRAGKKDKLQQDIDKANFYGELYETHKTKCYN